MQRALWLLFYNECNRKLIFEIISRSGVPVTPNQHKSGVSSTKMAQRLAPVAQSKEVPTQVGHPLKTPNQLRLEGRNLRLGELNVQSLHSDALLELWTER